MTERIKHVTASSYARLTIATTTNCRIQTTVKATKLQKLHTVKAKNCRSHKTAKVTTTTSTTTATTIATTSEKGWDILRVV